MQKFNIRKDPVVTNSHYLLFYYYYHSRSCFHKDVRESSNSTTETYFSPIFTTAVNIFWVRVTVDVVDAFSLTVFSETKSSSTASDRGALG